MFLRFLLTICLTTTLLTAAVAQSTVNLQPLCEGSLLPEYVCSGPAPDNAFAVLALLTHYAGERYPEAIEGYYDAEEPAAGSDARARFPPDTVALFQEQSRAIVGRLARAGIISTVTRNHLERSIERAEIVHPYWIIVAAANLAIQASLDNHALMATWADRLDLFLPTRRQPAIRPEQLLAQVYGFKRYTGPDTLPPAAALDTLLSYLHGVAGGPALQALGWEWQADTVSFGGARSLTVRHLVFRLRQADEVLRIAISNHAGPAGAEYVELRALLQEEELLNLAAQLAFNARRQPHRAIHLGADAFYTAALAAVDVPPLSDDFAWPGPPRSRLAGIWLVPAARFEQIEGLQLPITADLSLPVLSGPAGGAQRMLPTSTKNAVYAALDRAGLLKRYSRLQRQRLDNFFSSVPMRDTVDLLNAMLLAAPLPLHECMQVVTDVYRDSIRNVSLLSFLEGLTLGEMQPKLFSHFRARKKKEWITGLEFRLAGRTFAYPAESDGSDFCRDLLYGFADAWKQTHPKGRRFYFVPGVRGMPLVYLKPEEAQALSDVFNWLIKPVSD
jgi:hypothetical protein